MAQQFGDNPPDEPDQKLPEGTTLFEPNVAEVFYLLDAVDREAQKLLTAADPIRAHATELFGPLGGHPMPSQNRAPLAPE